jgi:hypothetical protein
MHSPPKPLGDGSEAQRRAMLRQRDAAEIMTLGNMREHGVHSLAITCGSLCGGNHPDSLMPTAT